MKKGEDIEIEENHMSWSLLSQKPCSGIWNEIDGDAVCVSRAEQALSLVPYSLHRMKGHGQTTFPRGIETTQSMRCLIP